MPETDPDSIRALLRSDYWASLARSPEVRGGDRLPYVVCRIGTDLWGIPAERCREVLRHPPIVPLPRGGPHVRGVLNLRGDVISAVDLAGLLGRSGPPAPRPSVVVVEAGLRIGFLVDGVIGVVEVERSAIEPSPEAGGGGAGAPFRPLDPRALVAKAVGSPPAP